MKIRVENRVDYCISEYWGRYFPSPENFIQFKIQPQKQTMEAVIACTLVDKPRSSIKFSASGWIMRAVENIKKN